MSLNELTYTYSLNKALEDDNDEFKDYLGAFTPFIINYLKKANTDKTKIQIQHGLEEEYKFTLPLHVLSSLLERLDKEGYLIKDKDNYKLVINKEYKYTFSDPDIIKHNLISLIKDLNKHLTRKIKKPLSIEETCNSLRVFIYLNFDPLITTEDLEKNFHLAIEKMLNCLIIYPHMWKLLKKKSQIVTKSFLN